MYKKYIVSVIMAASMIVHVVPINGMPDAAKADIASRLGNEAAAVAPVYNPLAGPSYPVAQNSYFTDDSGNILMFVNILGQVSRQGQYIVRENADFAAIIAISGGLVKDADLKKVLVVRQEPDENGKQAYVVNLKTFYKKGDRSDFIALKPNDTIIIPEKGISLAKISQYSSIISPLIYWYYIIDNNNK
ncbi:hypothetical protein BIU88_00405 [Chlorobaculum limnaeum]|uniref:SLBB domain-containing protein n=1 Tax=Chlorobaculum limnaeum TaxID=274537 RepID=A0A1D8D005_CHLLM|nr:hypothetical protein [Chlorobaculum limnaeum]AOS82745.1 hypothetical protein BIU88_00405 [Chlorobaculum limnaeum]